jgi:hypothetical protein
MKQIDTLQRSRASITGKLRSKAGETISETLIALLISALALVMLAGAVSAARHMIDNSRLKFGQYYAANETITKMDGNADAGTKKMTVAEGNKEITSIDVVTYTNDVMKQPVITYKRQTP